MAHAPRNSVLVPGVSRYSRSAVYSKKALYKRQKTNVAAPAKQTVAEKTVEVKGAKNGGKRTVPAQKAPRFYPAEDVPQPKVSRKTAKKTALRSTITPGNVVILLAGRYRGKRAVVLMQLDSGLLLVTGPFKVNGVPLRRVNQAISLLTVGTRESAFRNVKTVAECLADELINAAKGSANSYAIKKKDELERVAKCKCFFCYFDFTRTNFFSLLANR